MNILFVGDLNIHARSFQRCNTFKDMGHRVFAYSFIPEGRLPGINKKTSLIERILRKVGIVQDKTGINKKILNAAFSNEIDVIWIEKGLMIRPATLCMLKGKLPKTKIISYSEDDMFARHNRSLNYTRSLKWYDTVFTTKSYNCTPNELPSLGAKRVVFVDKSYDKHFHRPIPVTDSDKAVYGSDIGFIGTFEQERAQAMDYLAQNGLSVRIWGNGWKNLITHNKNLTIENKPLYGDEYIKGICTTKINLCFLRKINRDLQTDRTMEIPACAGFMLAERTEEHKKLFEEDKEAVYFNINDLNELLDKARQYLLENDQRKKVAHAGYVRCQKSKYSHHDRLEYMLNEINR